MNRRYFWNATESATLEQMSHAGATNQQIADATGRTIGSVRRRRQETVGKRQRTGKTREATPLERRIVVLEATIEREMGRDWDYVDELLGGLEWLKARAR